MNSILVLTNNIGGLHSFRKEVMAALIDAGNKVYISYPDNDERANYFDKIGCNMIHLPFNRRGMNPLKDLKLLYDYIKLVKRVKPKAVLTYTIKPNIYGGMACALCKVPQLANITGLGDSIENPGLLQKISVFLYKLGLRKANTVFFQNSANRQFCISHGIVKEEQSKQLPGSGVNTKHHTYQEYPEDGVTKFLFISRLLKDKGTDEYFATAKYIKSRYPNTEFQILGTCEGNYQEQLDLLCNDGIITFWGSTSDVRPYIGKVHCCIMPSYHEGLSNVNLEGAANGRPVITTNVPGCKETVDDGITGLLCEARSAESLIDAVKRFLQMSHEEKRQMGIAGRQKVERDFDRQIVVNAYLDAVNNVSK